MCASRSRLPRLHFHFSKRKTRIEFDADKAQLTRLRDDGSQFLPCRNSGRGMCNVFFGGRDACGSNGGSPLSFETPAFGGEQVRVLHRFFCACVFTLRKKSAGEGAPSQSFEVAGSVLLKKFDCLPDCGFLVDGRMSLFQGQTC